MRYLLRCIGSGVLSSAILSTTQPPAPGPTGVPECDRYVAMVRQCLPKMCGEDGALRELELDLALEAIAASVKVHGPQAAAKACIKDIEADIREDLYGCYPGSPAASQTVEIRASASGAVIRFEIEDLAAANQAEVTIASSLLEEPDATYRVTGSHGVFSLDTHVARPGTPDQATPAAPAVLASGTTYCYAIGAAAEGGGQIVRQGTFTTSGVPPGR